MAAEHARTGAGLLHSLDYALSQRNTPQTFEHRAFPRFGRDIGALEGFGSRMILGIFLWLGRECL